MEDSMPRDDAAKADGEALPGDSGPGAGESAQVKEKALALSLELSKRALEAESLDELFFMLTNDLRILVEFDRALLITHLGGKSSLVAATNQPALQKKFKFYEAANELAGSLKSVDRGVWLSGAADAPKLSEEELAPDARDKLISYIGRAGCSFILCVPLKHNNAILGHLLLEFYEAKLPNRIEILTVLSIAPFLASALSEKWLFHEKPSIWALVTSDRAAHERMSKYRRFLPAILVAAAVLCFAFVAVPVHYTVGGTSEMVPRDRHMAFAKMDGLVERIDVKEGSKVEKDQVLAVLDKRELFHEIKSVQRRFEILTKQMAQLRSESARDPSKLAESELVSLKRTSAWEEMEYLKWKRQFLEVRSPVSGIVVTKDVDSFVGKRFRAGEPFCEIVVPGDLWVTIYVPENKISLVKRGQPATMFLDSEPSKGYSLKVEEISCVAQVLPRIGNVYRVRAPLGNAPSYVKAGMKGIGKIDTLELSLFRILVRRLHSLWNRISIYF
jgi:Barrel-sandwich domain of CusB or HlyD membrane-fusion